MICYMILSIKNEVEAFVNVENIGCNQLPGYDGLIIYPNSILYKLLHAKIIFHGAVVIIVKICMYK